MTHAEAVAYVEGLDLLGMRFGLHRMHALLRELGDPHRHHPCVHVVGTNGKTSTTRFIHALLRAHGLRTGAYTSPHVTDWSERVLVEGAPIAPEACAGAVTRVREAADAVTGADDPVTQFEVLTAAAFVAHADAGLDAAVIEAGLGGRFDATNVLDGGRVAVLTNVALEHTRLLGDTLHAIAGEKLAVVPDGGRQLVVGRLTDEARQAVTAVCRARDLDGWWLGRQFAVFGSAEQLTVRVDELMMRDLRLGAGGGFQRDNAAVAVAAAHRFMTGGVREDRVRAALAATRVPGRMEVVPGSPTVVMDGAHNPAGMRALMESLPEGVRPVAVLSLLDDKDEVAVLGRLAQGCAHVVATRSAHRRATAPHALADAAGRAGIACTVVPEAAAALDEARRLAGPEGTVLVCGSLYLLAELRPLVLAPR